MPERIGLYEQEAAVELAGAVAARGFRPGYAALLRWRSERFTVGPQAMEALERLHPGRSPEEWDRWWEANRQRLAPAPAGPAAGGDPAVLVQQLSKADPQDREALIDALVASRSEPQWALVALLLGDDRALRDAAATVLARRKARWAQPLLVRAVRGGRALPASTKAEAGGQRRLTAAAGHRRKMPGGFAWLDPDQQMKRRVGRFEDPLAEALLACGGARGVAPLVDLSRNRSDFFRGYVILRLRDVFATRASERVDWFERKALDGTLARWSAWAARQQPDQTQGPRLEGPLARMAALPLPGARRDSKSISLIEQALADPDLLPRRGALVSLWSRLNDSERRRVVEQSKGQEWSARAVVEAACWDPALLPSAALPAELRRQVEAAYREQVEYALAIGRLEQGAGWAGSMRKLPELEPASWSVLGQLAGLRRRPREAVLAWSRYLDRQKDFAGYWNRGWHLRQQKQWAAAAADYGQALVLAQQPIERARAHASQGVCYLRLGRHAEAEACFLAWKMTGIAADQVPPWLARVAWGQGSAERVLQLSATLAPLEREMAAQDLQQRMLHKRGDPELGCLRVMALVRLQRLAQAEKLLGWLDRRVRNQSSKPPELPLAQALYHAARGNREAAYAALGRAIERETLDPEQAGRLPEFKQWAGRADFQSVLERRPRGK